MECSTAPSEVFTEPLAFQGGPNWTIATGYQVLTTISSQEFFPAVQEWQPAFYKALG
jgi:hypothetical protein